MTGQLPVLLPSLYEQPPVSHQVKGLTSNLNRPYLFAPAHYCEHVTASHHARSRAHLIRRGGERWKNGMDRFIKWTYNGWIIDHSSPVGYVPTAFDVNLVRIHFPFSVHY